MSNKKMENDAVVKIEDNCQNIIFRKEATYPSYNTFKDFRPSFIYEFTPHDIGYNYATYSSCGLLDSGKEHILREIYQRTTNSIIIKKSFKEAINGVWNTAWNDNIMY